MGALGLMLAVTTPLFLLDPRPSQDGTDKDKWMTRQKQIKDNLVQRVKDPVMNSSLKYSS